MSHEILIFEGVQLPLNIVSLLWHGGYFHAKVEHFQISVVFYMSVVLACTDYIIRNLLSRKHLNRLQYREQTSQAGHRISLLYCVFDFDSIIMISQRKVEFTRQSVSFIHQREIINIPEAFTLSSQGLLVIYALSYLRWQRFLKYLHRHSVYHQSAGVQPWLAVRQVLLCEELCRAEHVYRTDVSIHYPHSCYRSFCHLQTPTSYGNPVCVKPIIVE